MTWKITGTSHPSIVTDGLVLNLDAANQSSYPGSGATWTDLTGNGNNGTLQNGVGFDSGNGGSLSFDGVDDYVTIPANSDFVFSSSTDFTIEAWIYPTGYKSRNTIISSFPGAVAGNWIFALVNDKLAPYVYPNSALNFNWTSSSSVPLNQWSYVTLTRIGTTWTIFINGILENTQSVTQSMGNLNQVRIGHYEPSASGYFDGNISITRVYKGKGLTPQEVLQNYNALKGRFGL